MNYRRGDTWRMGISGRRKLMRLLETVPLGIGLTGTPSTGDAVGDTRRGRSVSNESIISAAGGGGGWFGEAADADISRCHSRQERFSSRRPS